MQTHTRTHKLNHSHSLSLTRPCTPHDDRAGYHRLPAPGTARQVRFHPGAHTRASAYLFQLGFGNVVVALDAKDLAKETHRSDALLTSLTTRTAIHSYTYFVQTNTLAHTLHTPHNAHQLLRTNNTQRPRAHKPAVEAPAVDDTPLQAPDQRPPTRTCGFRS